MNTDLKSYVMYICMISSYFSLYISNYTLLSIPYEDVFSYNWFVGELCRGDVIVCDSVV